MRIWTFHISHGNRKRSTTAVVAVVVLCSTITILVQSPLTLAFTTPVGISIAHQNRPQRIIGFHDGPVTSTATYANKSNNKGHDIDDGGVWSSRSSHRIRYATTGRNLSYYPSVVASPRRARLSLALSAKNDNDNDDNDNNSYIRDNGMMNGADDDKDDDDLAFNAKTTISLVVGQASLILVAIGVAAVLGTPNYGLGPGFGLWGSSSLSSSMASSPWTQGMLYTLPLGGLAFALDFVEDSVPALQDVSKAAQRSVLSLLGGSFRPLAGLATAVGLGIAAGVGEEMLFRGVLQYELVERFGGNNNFAAVGLSSVIFGALHAVTPLYAAFAFLASVYFGWLYLVADNLAVPMVTHAVYDIASLLYAHWVVTQMEVDEQRSLLASWDDTSDC